MGSSSLWEKKKIIELPITFYTIVRLTQIHNFRIHTATIDKHTLKSKILYKLKLRHQLYAELPPLRRRNRLYRALIFLQTAV